VPGRQVGWVQIEADIYVRPVRRLAVRCRKQNGQWGIGVIVSALAPQDVLVLTGQPPELPSDDHVTLLAYAHFYDQRGGRIETAIKDDKQGLGIRPETWRSPCRLCFRQRTWSLLWAKLGY
jgi:hypothetical protein